MIDRTPRQSKILPALVVALVTALGLWRAAYVAAGLDPDTDAYGHHVIARKILENPRDLGVHWVWLPLFHYVQALAIVLGATLQSVRYANVVISAAVPIVLFATLREVRMRRAVADPKAEPFDDAVPFLGATICALSPIAMQMGTTGQTEPIFALLTVAIAHAFAVERPWRAAGLLTAAVLIRYEAWAIVPALAVALGLEFMLDPTTRWRTRHVAWWASVVLPCVAIVAWAALRRPVDGGWFLFVRHTRQFANTALGTRGALDAGRPGLFDDLGYYIVKIPWRCIGYPLVLAPFGLVRTIRREGWRFCAIFSAVLAFITLVWVVRASLGLDRHFVAVVPLYATMIAEGVVALAHGLERLVRRSVSRYDNAYLASRAAGAAIVGGLAAATFALEGQLLDRWMGDWRHASEDAWPDRREVAAYLHEHSNGTVFCDESTIEVLSGLPRQKFDRGSVDDDEGLARVRAVAQREGQVYVASWAASAKRVRAIGDVVMRRPGWAHDDEGLVVVVVRAGR